MSLRVPIMVGFFLAGLVILGGVQAWWLEPVLTRLGDYAMVGATLLTAFNDNAAVTFLASTVPNLPEAVNQVAEAFRLRCRAVSAGDVVPVGRVGRAGTASPGIEKGDDAARLACEAHAAAARARQREIRKARALFQMLRGAVVDQGREIHHRRGLVSSQACTSAAF